MDSSGAPSVLVPNPIFEKNDFAPDALMDRKWTTDLSWVSLRIAQYFYVD
jgi:hypothetical protein